MMNVTNVQAGLKDIKVTTKGVNITFEDVRLDGEELTDLAELIGSRVALTVEQPQASIFDDEFVNELAEGAQAEQAEEQAEESSELTEEEIAAELNLN